MKKSAIITLLVAGLSGIPSIPVAAGEASNALGTCMVDSLTGKERKQLAQWIFFAMSYHPEIMTFAKVTEEAKENSDKTVGYLVTRLLTEDCPEQAKLALKMESSVAIQNSFGLVGQVAMQELMTNQDVNMAITSFERYVDKNKINELGVNP